MVHHTPSITVFDNNTQGYRHYQKKKIDKIIKNRYSDNSSKQYNLNSYSQKKTFTQITHSKNKTTPSKQSPKLPTSRSIQNTKHPENFPPNPSRLPTLVIDERFSQRLTFFFLSLFYFHLPILSVARAHSFAESTNSRELGSILISPTP